MNRTLIIGDAHGCLHEVRQLIKQASFERSGDVIFLGDLVDRGPDTPGLLEYFDFHRPRFRAVMGNHELKHINHFEKGAPLALSQKLVKRLMTKDEYTYAVWLMRSFCRYIDLGPALLVHGFFAPGVPLERQEDKTLLGVLSKERELEKKYQPRPWFEFYDGPKPLIVGHKVYNGDAPLIWNQKVFGLDTGCVFGGRLTGLILPEWELVSVPAERNYWAANLDRLAEQKAKTILKDLKAEHEKVVAGLSLAHGYFGLPPKEQAKLYAKRVAAHPLRKLLNDLRKGKEINLSDVLRCVPKSMLLGDSAEDE
ncbi:MAG: metallophosphoesterase [Elusimicrobiota bacterium]|nr:metallophosphoesterase [Elusimicrobiota bacterium]